MRYSDDITELARAAALLVAAGPPAAGALPDDEQLAALVCRDTVAGELRDLTRAVLQAGPDGTGADPQLLAASPPHALHAALIDLPAAAEVGRPLSQALAVAGGPLTRAWQNAARAAAALERYHDVAAELTGPNAWSLARDVADLAAALPTLDTDLATALPPTARPVQRCSNPGRTPCCTWPPRRCAPRPRACHPAAPTPSSRRNATSRR